VELNIVGSNIHHFCNQVSLLSIYSFFLKLSLYHPLDVPFLDEILKEKNLDFLAFVTPGFY